MKKIIITATFILGLSLTAAAQQSQAEGNDIKHKMLLETGATHLEKGDYKSAIATYNEALAYNVDTKHTLELRAMAYNLNKEYKAALADLDKLIDDGGDNLAQLYFMRSVSKLGIQDSEGACIDLKQARELGHKVDDEGIAAVCE